ncbi:ABC transporter ATP-binding protein/permease [Spiroplasma gladiatoris]|uniref:ABC transporter ATP-binding protein/permease n=1 Tax=Spiroplasma gladiatoris TaxID=2143 RepID=A0A4P7AH80_9MOLU|nr:ABC transporter ATP-binding protein [Spiroplasma gladiatoris]QBQ07532.1 ABC transporter ATP-binding protein/permease [Spiroplasma gladiatoris]
MAKNKAIKDSSNNINLISSKDIKNNDNKNFKIKKKGGAFTKTVFYYMKKNKLITFFMFLICIVSSVTTVLGPKIIQNIMTNLLAPTDGLEHFLAGAKTPEAINELLKGKVFILGNHGDILNENYVSDSKNYYTLFMGLHFSWMQWIYLQISLFFILGVCAFFSSFLGGTLGKKIEIDLRNKALENLVKQDMSYYSDKKIGELLTKIVSDTQIIGEQTSTVPVTIISTLVTFFGSLGVLLTIDSTLTLIVFVLMLILLIIIESSFGVIKNYSSKVRKTLTTINGDVTDRIATVRLIKSSGTESFENKRFGEVHVDYYKKSVILITIQSILSTIMIAGISSVQIIVIISASILYKDDAQYLTVTLSTFIVGLGSMVGPLMTLSRIMNGIIQASTCCSRISEIISSKPLIDSHYDSSEGVVIEEIKGSIVFQDVEFAYPEKPNKVILPKFSFTFEQGKSYAFVGETGAGKSTISKLLLRFYDPSKGDIFINNNINLKDIHLSSYLDKVGYVEQEPQVLYGDVFDNIRYGNFEASDQEVINAAKKANLHNLVLTWPEGYKTILGERGFMLSGGQKQRLVIARMFLKNPQILILDEATSALDNIVEKEIQLELEKLMKGRTTVSIAHRLSTIQNCDQIIVLGRDKGIVQIGSYQDLKTEQGHFKRLYEAGLMD